MNILFLTDPNPNYVPDLLLHGLRKLIGPSVVDYPRKECLYSGFLGLGICHEDQLCPNWFPPDNNEVDREDISAKISKGYFKYIICDIRALSLLQNFIPSSTPNLVIIDGEDQPLKIAPGPYIICRRETDGTDFSLPLPMALPEEIFQWITNYDNNKKEYSIGFLGCHGNFNQERKRIAENLPKYYPDSLIRTTEVPSEAYLKPNGRLSRDEYYKILQKCKIVLSLPGDGYDTFRLWENAACNAIHISQKMPIFIPNDFEDNSQILRFVDFNELRQLIDSVLEEKINPQNIIQEGRYHLLQYHFTTKRAVYFIDRISKIFCENTFSF